MTQAMATPGAPAAPVAGAPMFDWSTLDWTALAVNWAIAGVILLLGIWMARWVSRVMERALTRGGVEATLSGFLRNISYAAMVVLVFIAALQKIGVPTTSVLAVVGAAGLAVGLALKDSLSNIASGVMLIVLRPFRAGDAVKLAGLDGTVEQVRIFTTQMRTAQNEVIVMPNSQITTNPILNYTGKHERRIDVRLVIGYDQRIDRSRDVLLEAARADRCILQDPPVEVVVDAMGATGVEMVLRAWARTSDYGQVRSQLLEAVHRGLADAGIAISTPQRGEMRLIVDEPSARKLEASRGSNETG